MTWEIKHGDWIDVLRAMPDGSVHCVVTSPPYWGLRDYGTARWEGGDSSCEHVASERWYTEKTAATCSADAFSVAGEANAKRLKDGRWREKGFCTKCGSVKVDGQLGLERTPEEYVAKMVEGFREVRRVLRSDGVLWLNLGDSYAGSWGAQGGPSNLGLPPAGVYAEKSPTRNPKSFGVKPKDLCGIPWMVAFALRSDGWYLRQDIIWAKPNPMPESVRDRCTKAHEYIFLLSKSERYYYDNESVAENISPNTHGGNFRGPGDKWKLVGNHSGESLGQKPEDGKRNKRSVWRIATNAFPEAHFATFPTEIPEICIKAGTSERGCCPLCGYQWERIPDTPDWRPTCFCAGFAEGDGLNDDPIPCTVLDPFNGAGTTGLVATRLGRNYIGIELNPAYIEMAKRRIEQDAPLFNIQQQSDALQGEM